MGYTTNFIGQFELDKPLTVKQKLTLEDFAEERHGGNLDVFEGFPGFWCQWIPNSDGTAIEWDGNEKFYNYVEWLEYIIEHFIKPWGLTLNGKIKWYGEDPEDVGLIEVEDNKVVAKEGKIVYS